MDGERSYKISADPSFFNKRAVVKEITIFGGLSWLTVNRIARLVELVEFPKGSLICRQGAPADAFYAMVSGRVTSYQVDARGQKDVVDVLVRGMHFGTISALTGENHSHTYQAVNDSLVLKIKKEDFAELLQVTPKLALALSVNLSLKARERSPVPSGSHENALIAVYAPSGGNASGAYAASLASSLKDQAHGSKVLLLRFSSDPSSSLLNLQDIISDHQRSLQAVSQGNTTVDTLEVRFDPKDPGISGRIGQFAGWFVKDYERIVFDLSGPMEDAVIKLLIQSDIIHLSVRALEAELELARQAIEVLSRELKEEFSPDKVRAVIDGQPGEGALKPEDIRKVLNYDSFVVLPYLEADYILAVQRLGRQITGTMIGLVLGGGAALGMAHVGVIRVLEREKIPVDVVVGSSMGALIGGLWVSGHNADDLEKIAREFSNQAGLLKLFDPPVQRGLVLLVIICVFWLLGYGLLAAFLIFMLIPLGVVPVSGVVKGKAIGRWLKSKFGRAAFHDTSVPLRVVGYDLLHRREIVIDQGIIMDAVFKSIAIPGIIPPVTEAGQMVIDGGVLNPLPVNVLTDMGIKRIIAVNVLQSPEEVCWGEEWSIKRYRHMARVPFKRHPWKFISLRLGGFLGKFLSPNIADIIVRTLQASEYIFAENSGRQANVLIHPDLRGIQWFELYEVDKLIQRGHEAAMQHLPAMKAMVKKEKQ
ncbi:MAG: patatin-like phospholipase family protein [Candidatus Omnitrophota bacterium]